ncbi:MAG: ATPase V, partial [Nitrosopumilus sp.]|nr:ATPase V [Nitrosopumilus sp.]
MIQSLASLEKLVIQLRQKKQEATKLRKKAEDQVKAFRATEKRSSSGLQSIDKKIESEKEESTDVSTVLTRKNSQLESIGRLIAAAEQRLGQEKEAIEQTEQEIEFAENPLEKQNAEARLRSLNDHVNELNEEIKSRQKTAKKISGDVTSFSDIQSKIVTKIQNQTKTKPSLREAKIESRKSAQKFLKELERRTKAEESVQKSLDNAYSKLKELLAKKKTAAKKKPAKKKTAAKKKPAKKKTAAKKKPAKKKTAAKKKPAK